MSTAFNPLDSKLLSQLPLRLHKKSGWTEHTPFAMLLVELLQPSTIVELGTQHGVSYCAFCQAVEELKLPTLCYAVDTWKGDAHATHYKESVYTDLVEHHHRYEAFSKLLRMTFDQALPQFADASIDLLHIDGLHYYETVKKDFDTWHPKLSDRAIVLFHDTMETHAGFGVHQLWSELSAKFPGFNFEHGHGLGVLAVGPREPQPTQEFLAAANSNPRSTRALFAALGRRVQLETEKQWHARQSPIARALSLLKSKS